MRRAITHVLETGKTARAGNATELSGGGEIEWSRIAGEEAESIEAELEEAAEGIAEVL